VGMGHPPGEMLFGIKALALPVFDGAGQFVATLATIDSIKVIGTRIEGLKIAAMRKAAFRITPQLSPHYFHLESALCMSLQPSSPGPAQWVRAAALRARLIQTPGKVTATLA